jgi:hypothetical protein
MPLTPDICCRTCQIAANETTSRAVDMNCVDCCVRHLLHMIGVMGQFGTDGHADRIEDALFEALERKCK